MAKENGILSTSSAKAGGSLDEDNVKKVDCKLFINGACLDHDYKVINCTTIQDCTFIFYCTDLKQRNTECFYPREESSCSSIDKFNYTVFYNYFRLLQYLSDPQLSNGRYKNSYTETNEEDLFLNISHSLIEDSSRQYGNLDLNSNTCRYTMNDFLSTGEIVGKFALQFDRMKNKVILQTTISANNLRCYGRRYNFTNTVSVSQIPTFSRTRDLVWYYELNMLKEPNIYFCDVVAPMMYRWMRTEEVVGYTNALFSKYIIKISPTYDSNLTFALLNIAQDQQCEVNKFTLCTLMESRNNSIFYFVQDTYSRNFKDAETVIKKMVEDAANEHNPNIEYIRNIEYCLHETTSQNGRILTWNQTLIGITVTSVELCLDEDGMQVTRICAGDFFTGAYWLDPSSDCSETVEIPQRTYRLHQLVGETYIEEVFTNITIETDNFKEFTPVDVNLISYGLNSLSMRRNIRNLKADFFHGINNIMRINTTVLRSSQEQLNSTDKILDSIDGFMANVAQDITNISMAVQSNLITQITYPFISNIVGLALYNKGVNNFSSYEILDIRLDESFEVLNLENLELAMYVPMQLIYNLTSNMSDQEKMSFKIINTVFYNDGLFNEVDNVNRSAGSRIINVNIPGFSDTFGVSIPLLFRKILNFTDPKCVYWDFGQQKYGQWSTDGGQFLGPYNNESLIQCTFSHITHFALLVLSGNIIIGEDGVLINPLEDHELALTLITLIGCGLSLFGITGILMTAIIFKDWYKKRINSIQLSIVMLLEIIVLFVADLDVIIDGPSCMAVGAILHYIVLAKFVWMLIIARLQYLKFVSIFENMQVKRYAVIHTLIGWLFPVIPVVLSLLIFPTSYSSGSLNFCYARGYVLYFFLILPACAIILVNITIFISIMVSISRSKCQDYGMNIQKLQFRLAIMLFFMLGITWIFGLIGEFLPWSWFKLVCLYIFCILGPIQGFIMFVFTVLLDKGTMDLWGDMFKFTPKREQFYEPSTRSEVLFTSQTDHVSVNYFGKRD